MEPTQELIDDIYREQCAACTCHSARAEASRPAADSSSSPARLMMDGIRHENPGADEDQVREILARRLDLRARLEQFP